MHGEDSKNKHAPEPRGNRGHNWQKTPKKSLASLSPQLHGLGATGRVPNGGNLAQPRVEKMPQSFLQVVDSLANDPDFMKVGCHIGNYITVTVNTKVKQVDIQALHSDLASTSLRINVSSPFSCSVLSATPDFFTLSSENHREHSMSKDKFLKASLRKKFEAQDFKD
jgi:hypothetical protein